MTATINAHGLDGGLVAPDWPPLTGPETFALLRRFPECDGPIKILSVSPRPFSAASVVAVGAKRVFVKRHPCIVRDREGLLEEHRFLDHLRGRGAPVAQVLATDTGETAIEIGDWTYEVHAAMEGVDLYEQAISWTPFRSARHAFSAGEMLARLHRLAEGFTEPARKVQPLVSSFSIFASADPATAMRNYLDARPALAHNAATHQNSDEALEQIDRFHAELLPLLPELSPLWTQNDLHGSNTFWSDTSEDARAVGAVDFGLADRTNAVHDLAIAIERNIVEWLTLMNDPTQPNNVAVHIDQLDALLAGYERVRPLSNEEAAALAPMTALCHAEFALTEADYFLGVLRSPEKARVATDAYLVGHARWFHSSAGRALLDHLRRWAHYRVQTRETMEREAARR
jgi:Ser/Thr protein kinase RdoA (MazF antagonist)